MWIYPQSYQVIVIGGGHAGCEAALASARMGSSTLLLTMSADTVGKMSCNPAIGGVGKGQIVREIDALGGEMGKATEASAIQSRMLNRSKGAAVWSPRAQCDRFLYQQEMKQRIEKQENLSLQQGTAEELLFDDGRLIGVATKEGIAYHGDTVVLSSGTFMRGLIHIGEMQYSGGRSGDQSAEGLSGSLQRLGLELGRLKTGTPPRIHRRSIDFSQTEEQPGEDNVRFSFDPRERDPLPQLSCHITYTAPETKRIIEENLHRSPMYSGTISGIGPRYCPSIEDKVVRFSDKERHQIFLEPEGLNTEEIYVNGVSSSLPFDVQLQFIHSIPALRDAEIIRPAYAIEYDYVTSGQLSTSLEVHRCPGLFLAGQINGTTGYEEAAGQGLIAGINAALKVQGRAPFALQRSEAYLGVMIDDLVTKTLQEPYRMFTSRAEHRLLLRQDNADLRLRQKGVDLGLIDRLRATQLKRKEEIIARECERFQKEFIQQDSRGVSLAQWLARPEESYQKMLTAYPKRLVDYGEETNQQIELAIKYAGYIRRQQSEVAKSAHLESFALSYGIDYSQIVGLRYEAQEKLSKHRPNTLGQAARIDGVSPADISILRVALNRTAS